MMNLITTLAHCGAPHEFTPFQLALIAYNLAVLAYIILKARSVTR